jgi:hypothetical protein
MPTLSPGRIGLLLLACAALTFSSCDDDDDTILGIDFDDDGTLFMSSNTNAVMGVMNLEDGDTPPIQTIPVDYSDADGIYYAEDEEAVFQVNRSDSRLIQYDDVLDNIDEPDEIQLEARSNLSFDNGRGLAFRNNIAVVAQQGRTENGNVNKLVVLDASEDDDDVLELISDSPTDFPLWGIRFVGSSLYAVVDMSDSVAIFENFLQNTVADTLMPTRYINVEGLVRTHGLVYDAEDDVMILTDIGDASDDSDGALYIIRDFMSFTGTTVTSSDYTVISGSNTNLGNPVDVAYDEATDRIYVAERAMNGGQLLEFEAGASGNAAPRRTLSFPGISSLYLHRD